LDFATQQGERAKAWQLQEHSWRPIMLFLVFVLLALWFLGVLTSYTLGGVLHVLLVIAIVLFLVHIIQGRSIGEA
jgi:hypothetical protein